MSVAKIIAMMHLRMAATSLASTAEKTLHSGLALSKKKNCEVCMLSSGERSLYVSARSSPIAIR